VRAGIRTSRGGSRYPDIGVAEVGDQIPNPLFAAARRRSPDHDLCNAPGVTVGQRIGRVLPPICMSFRQAVEVLCLIEDSLLSG